MERVFCPRQHNTKQENQDLHSYDFFCKLFFFWFHLQIGFIEIFLLFILDYDTCWDEAELQKKSERTEEQGVTENKQAGGKILPLSPHFPDP